MNDPQLMETLTEIRGLFPFERVVLVGGNALRLSDCLQRMTRDIDVVVDVGPAALAERMRGASRWRPDPSAEHRWLLGREAHVDFLPCGPEEIAAGHILWPREGAVMSVVGFRHVFARARSIERVNVGLADRMTLALLKVIAYLDRPAERRKDLGDFAMILDRYLEPSDPRYFDGPASRAGQYGDDASPWTLGFDLGAAMSEEERAPFSSFLSMIFDDRDRWRTADKMASDAPTRWRDDVDELRRIMTLLREALTLGAALRDGAARSA